MKKFTTLFLVSLLFYQNVLNAQCACTPVGSFPTVINGITVNVINSGDVTNYGSNWPSCGLSAGPLWVGQNLSFSQTFTFSSPVNNVKYVITAASTVGANNGVSEEFNFTTSSGVLSATQCGGTCPFNQVGNSFSNFGSDDGTTVVLSSTSTYNSFTVSGPGGSNGSLVGICLESIVNPCASPPSASAGASQNINCITPSVVLNGSVSGGTPSYAYGWTPATGLSNANIANPTANPSSTTSYVLTVTDANGCQSTSNTLVNVNTIPPAAGASSGGNVTCATANVTLTGTGGGSYSWTGPSIISGANTANPVINAGGTYNLTVTDVSNGCTASTSVFVTQNTTPPSATASSGGNVTCATANVTLTGTGGGSYSWTGPGIVSGGSSANPSINQAGTYNVTVTDVSTGCSAVASVTVSQNITTPSITLTTANSITTTCSSPTTNLSASSSSDPSTIYTWITPTSATITGNPITTSSPGTYSVYVTNTANGCNTSASTLTVDVIADANTPSVILSASSLSITCITSTVTLVATVNPNSVSYNWSPSSGILSGANSSSPVFNTAGSYSLVVTNTLNACATNISSNVVNVFANTSLPTVSVTTISTNSVIGCGSNSAVTFSNSTTSASGSVTYNWLPSGASASSFSATTAGVYTLVATDAVNSCSAATQFTVNGNTIAPNLTVSSNAIFPCGTGSITLMANSTATNIVYLWVGPSATSIVNPNNIPNPVVTDIGTYTLTVTDNLTNCQSTATVIASQANVTASITANPTTGLSPLTVNFTGSGAGATSFNWNFGGTNSSTLQNPSNIFVTGTYTVTLTTSSGSCSATASITIIVEDELTLEIPNVFTPNDDGVNDLFTIKSSGISELSLQIFNRWGQILYQFSGNKASWDGLTAQGVKVPDGTYFYFIKASGFNGKIIEQQGTVNLFR